MVDWGIRNKKELVIYTIGSLTGWEKMGSRYLIMPLSRDSHFVILNDESGVRQNAKHGLVLALALVLRCCDQSRNLINHYQILIIHTP